MKKERKKWGAAAAAVVMAMSTGTTAYALPRPSSDELILDQDWENWDKEKESQTNVGESMTITVNGTYTDSLEAQKVISADVAWESMKFTYAKEQQGTWNPENHSYEGGVKEAGWIKNNAKITLTNHSNTELTADFSFEPATDAYTGTFTQAKMTLATAEETAYADAPSDDSTFTISGAMDSDADTSLGTISVQLSGQGVSDGTDIKDIDSLYDVFKNGGTANLCGETRLGSAVNIEKNVTLDLRKYVLKTPGINVCEGGSLTVYGKKGTCGPWGTNSSACFVVNNGGTVCLAEGTYETSYQYLIAARAGTTIINGGIFKASGSNPAVQCDGGNVIINGGTFNNERGSHGVLVCEDGGSITINGGSFKGKNSIYACSYSETSSSTIRINGGYFDGDLYTYGEFTYLIITGGTFTDDPIEFVDTENYKVITNEDGTYTVSAK